jgi:hypothetical protein
VGDWVRRGLYIGNGNRRVVGLACQDFSLDWLDAWLVEIEGVFELCFVGEEEEEER